MISYSLDNNVAVLTWNMEGYPMNVLNEASISAFTEKLQQAWDDPQVKGIIITSARPEFVVGADLRMLEKNNSQDPELTLELTMGLNRLFRSLETCGKPVVAAINGTALGGGYEICLACHYRVALNHSKILIGLPEVTVGLLPGAGGTQRLPRMIGLEAALPLLIEGKKLDPQAALKAGLVNELVQTREELLEAAHRWIAANLNALQPWDQVDRKTGRIIGREQYQVPGGNVQSPAGARIFMSGTALLQQKTYGNYPAPQEIMEAVYEGLQVNIDRALLVEARHFVKVATSTVARNLIRTMFFGMNEANKGAARPKDILPTKVKRLGILGAGTMGAGIAYVSALTGIEVVIKDISKEAAEKGREYVRALLAKQVEKGQTTAEKAEAVLARLHPASDTKELTGCDLIIEAVFEDRAIKAEVTQAAEPLLTAEGVFASNTSTLPITGLAEASTRPENFLGLHFFSPVDRMQLVEVIRARHTSDYALALALDFVKKIQKTPIVVNDSRGFYTSRVFGTYTSEGFELLNEGVNPVLIENAGKAAGMPVGPLAVSDEVSLELIYQIAAQSEQEAGITIADARMTVIRLMVETLARRGKKAGKGFYEYPENGKKYLWPGLGEHFPRASQQPQLEEVKSRLLYRQAIESVRCLEEGVITSPRDADIGSILGWGFPTYTGGTLSFVDMVGIDSFVRECDRLAETYGDRFRPNEQLRLMAQRGEGFYEKKIDHRPQTV
jgi:3-hydroxyacyl-CoA dehydrogenase/enoyl-CoA hydratase/3-hydroxybutyryl-CoA epimerase